MTSGTRPAVCPAIKGNHAVKEILIADKADVLVLDDQPENLQVLIEALSADYNVRPFTKAAAMFAYLDAGRPADLFLLDVVMPDIDGITVCRQLREREELVDVPMIFLTSLTSTSDEEAGLAAGAADYITKPFSLPVVRARVGHHVELGRMMRVVACMNDFLDQRVKERTEELARKNEALNRAQEATVHALASLLETRDNDTGHHIRRTQRYVRALATEVRRDDTFAGILDGEMIDLLHRAAALHDIGKVAIPDRILLKPGRLDEKEFELMKSHTVHGRNAIANAERILGSPDPFLQLAREIALSHHERWDGNGYPEGRRGEDIPLSARLMAIADVYDALISSRPYKAGMPHEKAVEILRSGRGVQFDPDITDAFLRIHETFREISQELRDAEVAEHCYHQLIDIC